MKPLKLLFMLLVFMSCAFEDPVDSDYYMDVDLIKGKNKPGVPSIQEISVCENDVQITFTGTTDPDGDEITYLFYYSFENPENFSDGSEYYSILRLFGYAEDEGSISVRFTLDGLVYLWITAFDGGRESDHSEVWEVVLPGDEC